MYMIFIYPLLLISKLSYRYVMTLIMHTQYSILPDLLDNGHEFGYHTINIVLKRSILGVLKGLETQAVTGRFRPLKLPLNFIDWASVS